MRRRLLELGFVPIGPLADGKDAWKAAQATVNDANAEPPLAVIGDFMIPPSDGPPSLSRTGGGELGNLANSTNASSGTRPYRSRSTSGFATDS